RCASEGDSADPRQNIDATRLAAEHPHAIGVRELLCARSHFAEAERHERTTNTACIGERWLDEHVEVLSEPRLSVDGDGVPADQDEARSRGDQRMQELAPVVVEVDSR